MMNSRRRIRFFIVGLLLAAGLGLVARAGSADDRDKKIRRQEQRDLERDRKDRNQVLERNRDLSRKEDRLEHESLRRAADRKKLELQIEKDRLQLRRLERERLRVEDQTARDQERRDRDWLRRNGR